MTRRTRSSVFEKLSDASYSELFTLWMVINVLCAIWYFGLASLRSANAPTHLAEMDPTNRLFNSIYFSIITATSLGYGDIVPMGFSKVIAMVQSIVALMIFAIFVTKLVARHQDERLDAIEALLKKKK